MWKAPWMDDFLENILPKLAPTGREMYKQPITMKKIGHCQRPTIKTLFLEYSSSNIYYT